MRFFTITFMFTIAFHIWEGVATFLGWNEPTVAYSAANHFLLAFAFGVIYLMVAKAKREREEG